ncbi:MAG: threonine synthase [Lentisphaerae bacterium]|nr:threonine synthase [Lentisphaerota bacterium]
MRYVSTRGGIEPITFCDAVVTGLAPDGGLLLPETIPDLSEHLGDWSALPYEALALEVMRPFVDLSDGEMNDLVRRSYAAFSNPEVAPVVEVGGIHLAELFHGPTLAFKDVALQFLGNLFELILQKRGGVLNVLGATSGDTGSAAIHAVKGRQSMKIFVMHPHGKISRTQELQMTTVPDGNVFNIAIEGSFDDCQAIAKTIFRDLPFKERYSLGSVNSINWARVLAQVVYYFYGVFRVMERTGRKNVSVCVPTGNFGNIFAAYVAVRMGLPVRRLVLATNSNNILSRFFTSGIYKRGTVSETLSPSMDIQVASNFERYLYYRMGEEPARLTELMDGFSGTGQLRVDPLDDGVVDPLFHADSASDEEVLGTISRFSSEHGYLLDPHTAVGVCVARKLAEKDEALLCIGTAHPAKFGDAIRRATGEDAGHHPVIDALQDLPARCEVLPASAETVKDYIIAHA